MGALWILYRQRLRRDRWQVIVWVLSIGMLALFAVAAIAKTFGDDATRTQVLQLATAAPAILVLRGLPRGPALDSFAFFEIFSFLGVLAGLMNTFMAVRHTRAEEESGRAELISSTAAGRWAPLAATVLHGAVANVLVAVATALGFMAGGLDPAGSLVAGFATGAVGFAFFGVGLLASEFFSTSRGANGISSTLVVVAYLLRGVGDATGQVSPDGTTMTAAWPSWISPIGWGQQTFAYTGNRWWPLLLPLGLWAACTAVVVFIMARRDVGSSVLAGRSGRSDARPWLRGSFSLALRLQQGAIIGWCIGGLATGLLTGSLGSAIQSSITSNPQVSSVLRGMIEAQGISMTQLLVAALFEVAGILAAACGLQTVLRLRQEEVAGTAEPVVAESVGRMRWLGSFLGLGAVSVALVLAFTAVGAWASLAASGDTSGAVDDVWQTALDQLPAALIYLALPALVFVVWPRATIPTGWALLGVGVILGIYGSILGIDQKLRDLSPFTHTPVTTSTGTDWSGGFWMLGIAAVLAALALAAVRRREVGTA
ncbi:ABC transporter permease [Arthrobacter sp. KN11-1C]|uniref:ABC transporter permease n=1 Tax=Arthrobacter sp. KN11-1C TaxID=3445774 RepID=UPI003FA0C1D5